MEIVSTEGLEFDREAWKKGRSSGAKSVARWLITPGCLGERLGGKGGGGGVLERRQAAFQHPPTSVDGRSHGLGQNFVHLTRRGAAGVHWRTYQSCQKSVPKLGIELDRPYTGRAPTDGNPLGVIRCGASKESASLERTGPKDQRLEAEKVPDSRRLLSLESNSRNIRSLLDRFLILVTA